MEWTRELPTKPGFYWLCRKPIRMTGSAGWVFGDVEIVKVEDDNGTLRALELWNEYADPVSDWRKIACWWMGPIEVPDIPKDILGGKERDDWEKWKVRMP